jgi:heat shock protein 4
VLLQINSNYKNIVTQVKRLIGRKFSDPIVQADIADVHLYKVVAMEGDEVGVEVSYDDATKVFTPQAILGMLLGGMSEIIAQNNAGTPLKDVVLTVPPYFTQKQRSAVLDAGRIAGVNVLRLLNENTASALSYGMFRGAKREFSDDGSVVLFMDAGHSTFTATVAEFTNSSLKVKGCAYDTCAGGRDVDVALAKHFAAEFDAKHSTNVWSEAKARLKLLGAAEKAKKTLSPHGVNNAPVNVEFLALEHDFHSQLSVEKLDELAGPVGARIAAVVKRAIAQAGVSSSQLTAIELVGGGSRPRFVKRFIAQALELEMNEATGHGLTSTQNPDECVARGAALACAQLSPAVRVMEFAVFDLVEYPVRISWTSGDAAPDADAAAGASTATTKVLFSRGEAWPVERRRITFRQFGDFAITAEYDTAAAEDAVLLPLGQSSKLGQHSIAGVAKAGAEGADPPKVRVDFTLDLNGMFSILGAEMLQEVPMEPTPVATPAAEEGAVAAPAGEETKEGEVKPEGDAAPADADAAKTEGDKPKSEAAPPAPAAVPAKKKYHRTQLKLATVDNQHTGMAADMLSSAAAAEQRMRESDAIIMATQAKRNELETYVYDTRSALGDALEAYATEDVRSAFSEQLTGTEDWLYEEGFDADVATYAAKLAELRAVGTPMIKRKIESEGRDQSVALLLSEVESFRACIQSTTEANEHLTDADRDVIRSACNRAEDWLREQQAAQGSKAPHEDPVLTLADISGRISSMRGECLPIKNKPKPVPTLPAATEAAADKPEADAAASTEEAKEGEATPDDDAAASTETPASDTEGDTKLE